MNFLAHAFLSGDNENIMLGNLIADAVKGRQIENFSHEVIQGIKMHRKIDAFTDQHPVFIQSTQRLRPKYRKYSGVITDMYYDHFLAKDWDKYAKMSLWQFSRITYKVLMENYEILPYKTRRILPYMISGNWLQNYYRLERLHKSFLGMARRARFESGMEHAIDDLKNDYSNFHRDFNLFFPDMIQYVSKFNNIDLKTIDWLNFIQ